MDLPWPVVGDTTQSYRASWFLRGSRLSYTSRELKQDLARWLESGVLVGGIRRDASKLCIAKPRNLCYI